MFDPVIITGTPRSGIWLTAGAFQVAGGFSGLLDKSEPRVTGELENIAIRDRMERPLLEGLGFEPRGLGKIPPAEQIEKLAAAMKDQWRLLVDQVFKEQNCQETAIRFIASQVACLLWPIWNAAFPEAKWILVRRNEADIMASCRATGFVQSYRSPGDSSRRVRSDKELRLLINGYNERFEQMKGRHLNVTEFRPQLVYDGKLGALRSLLESHSLAWRPEVMEFVRPFQWKHGTLQTEGADHAHNCS
jgi:hypothetical protein